MKSLKMFWIMAGALAALSIGPSSKTSAQQTIGGAATVRQQDKKEAEPAPIYDESADAKEVIAAAVKHAKKENKRVLIQWGANWCGWCRLLHHLCETDREIARKLMYEYEVVLVDIGRWDKNLDLVEKYGADLQNSGVPYLTILDGDGRVLVNHDTGSLEYEQVDQEKQIGHDRSKVLALLTENQAEYRKADALLEEGLSDAARENKRVFLHFGAPWCGWCHRLENWMARPEVAEILAKEFVDVKIDTDRTIGGQDMLTKFRESERGGIPWMAILDAEGKKLITSDGPQGNVGFPVQPHEIAHFMTMLRETSKSLTADDLAFLEKSLQPKEEGNSGTGGAGH